MKRLFLSFRIVLFLSFGWPAMLQAQLQFKLQWLPDSLAWGVFVMPEASITPSDFLIIGSGQVTVVAPTGMQFRHLKCFSGTWTQNAFVAAPKENAEKDYISFGLETADPPMEIQAGEETLLFTFSAKNGDCPAELYLMENNDPFNQLPNSMNSNPGNDLSILDPGNKNIIYYFSKTYAPDAWNCHPGKGTPQGKFRHGYERRRNKKLNRP